MNSIEGGSERKRDSAPAGCLSPALTFCLIVAAYLAIHVALRLWETPNIGKNDVQEAVAAQVWAWGYHPRNPPLHTWLLMGSYALFGVSLLAHVVLKYVLLGAAFVFAYLCARRVIADRSLAVLSALSLMLVSVIAWTVHTALTHTLLMTALIFAALWAAIRMSQQRRALDYALFGLMLGLGFLAKYSFILFALPLLGAMALEGELRRALLNWRIALALLATSAVFAPHALWMLSAPFDFVAFLAEKQQSEQAHAYVVDAGLGLAALVEGALAYLAPFILVFPLAFWSSFRQPARAASAWARAMPLISVFGIAILVIDVLVMRATLFEERYMTCALITAPLAAFLWLDRRESAPGGMRRLAIAIAAVSIIVMGGLAGRALFYHNSCNRCWDEMRADALAQGLREAGFNGGTILADHYNVAGNMRLAFPNVRIYAANYFVAQPDLAGAGQCAAVWNARNAGDAPPAELADLLDRRGLAPAAPHFVEAPLRRSTERTDRFGYMLLDGDQNCRAR